MHITISLASNVTNELVVGWCITKWVKRLAGNEIELGMKMLTIASRESNIPTDKGNYVCCHNGSTDKDLRRICRKQYGHPGSSIGYQSERYLWALSISHITISLASNVTNELVVGWCITKWVKRLVGNDIELDMMIPTIESRASNIPMTKGTTYVVMRFDR